MKKNIFKIISLTAFLFLVISCQLESGDTITRKGKGLTVLSQTVGVVEDYSNFSRIGFAVKCYAEADAEKKIYLDNSQLSAYNFEQIDGIWKITAGAKTYYAKLDYDFISLGHTRIHLTRSRGYENEGRPVFDSCLMGLYGKSALTGELEGYLEITHTKTSGHGYFSTISNGAGNISFAIKGSDEELPQRLLISGKGHFTSTDMYGRQIELEWTMQEGKFDCFTRDHWFSLTKADILMKAGIPGKFKDNIEAWFDRGAEQPTLDLTVNGVAEDADPYFE